MCMNVHARQMHVAAALLAIGLIIMTGQAGSCFSLGGNGMAAVYGLTQYSGSSQHC
jgi:hypothetical protein